MCGACLKILEEEIKPSKCSDCNKVFCQPGLSLCSICETAQKHKESL
jgi:hypothetical protein